MSERLVYKYVTAERIDVLRSGSIRFTQPEALNDPFEVAPDLSAYKQALKDSALSKSIARFGDKAHEAAPLRQLMVDSLDRQLPRIMGDLFVFLSVSRVPDNLLMWAHYANSHSGFVIGFDSGHDFFKPGRLSAIGLRSVKYSKKRMMMPPRGLTGLAIEELSAANIEFLFTKSSDWEYEQEMRVLAWPRSADKTINMSALPPIRLFEFPTEMVREIIFGCRMDPATAAEIAALAAEQYPFAILKQARIAASTFSLELVPYLEYAETQKRLEKLNAFFQYEVKFKDDVS